MSTISTKLTKLLGIRTPVVCGAMAGGGGGSLAASVTFGGGFGFIAAGYGSIDNLRAEVEIARSTLKIDSKSPLPIGIGYLAWQLEQQGASPLDYLNVALEYNAKAVWLSFGNRIKDWITHFRTKESVPGAVKIFVQVSTVEEALVAANDWKADVIVAQGVEAGGHGLGSGPSMMTLVSEILSVIPEDGPAVLAAGGLVHGRHLASMLALGASGAVFGTRFLLSSESLYSDVKRNALISAKTSAAVRSMAFDQARNTLGWPRGVDGRGLRNRLVNDFEKGVEIDALRNTHSEGLENDDPNRTVIWAGTGIGLMNALQPAKDIVEEIHLECSARLREVAFWVQ